MPSIRVRHISYKYPVNIHAGHFDLDVSGVAGFFGGEEAISAMQNIHIYKYRKRMGWYNTSGSWNVGKKFRMLAKFIELGGKQGPKCRRWILEHTGYFAYLIMQICKEELGVQVKGRVTKWNKVTLIQTRPVFERSTEKEKTPVRTIPPHVGRRAHAAIDWFCCSKIFLGITSKGMFHLVIVSASLELQGVKSAPTAPPGYGMLMDGDCIVLLLGKEENVATITRGRFTLKCEPSALG